MAKRKSKRQPQLQKTSADERFMPFAELEAQWPGGRVQLYRALRQGVFPSIRVGRRFHILRAPTQAILDGRMPPGGQPRISPA